MIRFAGVATLEGEIAAAEYREGLKPLLTVHESELSIMHSLIRTNMRKTFEPKLGKTIYSFTEYENVKRATIVMYSQQQALEGDTILMISFDKVANAPLIIEEKIMPLLKRINKHP